MIVTSGSVCRQMSPVKALSLDMTKRSMLAFLLSLVFRTCTFLNYVPTSCVHTSVEAEAAAGAMIMHGQSTYIRDRETMTEEKVVVLNSVGEFNETSAEGGDLFDPPHPPPPPMLPQQCIQPTFQQLLGSNAPGKASEQRL